MGRKGGSLQPSLYSRSRAGESNLWLMLILQLLLISYASADVETSWLSEKDHNATCKINFSIYVICNG